MSFWGRLLYRLRLNVKEKICGSLCLVRTSPQSPRDSDLASTNDHCFRRCISHAEASDLFDKDRRRNRFAVRTWFLWRAEQVIVYVPRFAELMPFHLGAFLNVLGSFICGAVSRSLPARYREHGRRSRYLSCVLVQWGLLLQATRRYESYRFEFFE